MSLKRNFDEITREEKEASTEHMNDSVIDDDDDDDDESEVWGTKEKIQLQITNSFFVNDESGNNWNIMDRSHLQRLFNEFSMQKLKPKDICAVQEMKSALNKISPSLSDAINTAQQVAKFHIKYLPKRAYPFAIIPVLVLLNTLLKAMLCPPLKYPTIKALLKKYPDFKKRKFEDLYKLWRTANWMSFLFGIIKAKSNKCFVMSVLPKFLGKVMRAVSMLIVLILIYIHIYNKVFYLLAEGHDVNYSMGSGASSETRDRIAIYECEGQIKAKRRNETREDITYETRVDSSAADLPLAPLLCRPPSIIAIDQHNNPDTEAVITTSDTTLSQYDADNGDSDIDYDDLAVMQCIVVIAS